MNLKAANTGDQLKHALLMEVLRRIPVPINLTYAETHAGAGIYHSVHQVFEGGLNHPPIQQLREKQQDANVDQRYFGTGGFYHHWLRKWWGESVNHATYPGSAVTVFSYLRENFREFQLRLTESDHKTCIFLRDALQTKHAIIRNEPFQENLGWLTEKEPLFLLVDPFVIVPFLESGEALGRLNQGEIDFFTVRDIVHRCAVKEWAVLAFWWPSKDYRDQTHTLFQLCASEIPDAVVREFGDGAHHRMTLMGIGRGAAIVEGLPGSPEWDRSWLAGTISEVG